MSEFQFAEGGVPGTPPSGIVSMYADSSDSAVKTKDDSGYVTYLTKVPKAVCTRLASITVGEGKASFGPIPAELAGYNIVAISAVLDTIGRAGGPLAMQLRRRRSGTWVNVLSTALTIDANELDSSTAATAAVINTSNDDLAENDLLMWTVTATYTSLGYGATAIFKIQKP